MSVLAPPPRVTVGRHAYAPADVLRVLEPFVSPERLARIDAVVAGRTYAVLPVLDGLHDAGNVSAVLRSAEGLGCAAAELVALEGRAARLAAAYKADDEQAAEAALSLRDRQGQRRVSRGAHKWLHLRAWTSRAAFLRRIRAEGYRLAVTALRPGAQPIAAWDFTQPTALVVGNEAEGASPELLDAADAALLLPLDGFVQSYNVSVAAALALYHARADRLARQGFHGDLPPEARRTLRAHYVARAAPHAERLMRHGATPAGPS
ncbi:MAG: TrmH family RNA methyltransferase [Rubricoccaceae bacterium]